MSKLLNKSHVDPGINAQLIESDMISKAGTKLTRNINPDKEYLETMRELADVSGIPISDMNIRGGASVSGSYESSYDSDEFESGEEDDSEEGSLTDENDEEFISKLKKRDTRDARATLKPPRMELKDDRGHRHGHDVFGKTPIANPNFSGGRDRHQHSGQYQQQPQGYQQQNFSGHNQQQHQQHPQQQGDQFNQVLQGYGGGGQEIIDVEKETEEENKTFMLEDIDELMAELADDEVDLSRIPKVNQDSPIADVQQVQKILRMKYDRRRYTTFGTEFILAGVHGLEYLFDGKRKWGPYQPDLTNWHNTVRTKLRRMRYETSMIVADAMAQWNVGAFTRVMIELVPSAFLHSRMRSEQHGKAGYSPDQMSETYDALRQYDND
jgi:hypothetical protein